MIDLRIRHLAWLLFLVPMVTHACRCVMPLGTGTAYQRADLVVSAQVARVVGLDEASQTSETTFRIVSAWKADVRRELIAVSGETCAAKFELGQTWLVFLTKLENGRYATNRCAGNQLLDPAAKDGARALLWLRKHGRARVIQND